MDRNHRAAGALRYSLAHRTDDGSPGGLLLSVAPAPRAANHS